MTNEYAPSIDFPDLNPVVFIEFAMRENNKIFQLGRCEFVLYRDKVPRTVKNFITLLEKYKGSKLHRIIPGFMIQGGDFEYGDGTGGHSIYGKYFEDENLDGKHNEVGLLSMANAGPNTNGSQFFITLEYTPWLDGKHVVFGKIKKGLEVIKRIEKYGSENGKPKNKIRIVKCGVL